MPNKKISLLLLAAVLAVPVSAQTQTKKPTKQTASTQTRQELRSSRFDPRKPSIDMAHVSNILNNKIQKQLLQKKLPEKVEDMKDISTLFTDQYVGRYLFPYKVLITNPDLEEVSRVPMRWYKSFETLLDGFNPIAAQFTAAYRNKNQVKYASALEAFQKQQQTCLAFLKKRQPRLTSEQLLKIRNANIRRRRAEYNARLKKEREERLKKLQEENSQKNTEE